MSRALELLRHQDFLLVSETHSTIGKVRAVEHRLGQQGLRAYWSHGGHRRAGVGIIIRDSFLNSFNSSPPVSVDVAPGEVGILRLTGPQGQMDLCSIYLPTASQGEGGSSLHNLRSALRRKIYQAFRPAQVTLSLLGGDFNYVTDKMDRWSKHAASWSNMPDHKEQTDWETLFESKMGKLSELYQPHGTHDNAGARSRLDRIYTSSGVADQIDAQLGSAALDWCLLRFAFCCCALFCFRCVFVLLSYSLFTLV